MIRKKSVIMETGDRDKIKVLTVNCMIHEGSTSKIIDDIAAVAKEECEFYQCYQMGPESSGKNYRVASWNVTRFYYLLARIVGLKYGVGTIPTRKLLSYIDRTKPDIVHVHCPNFYNINLYKLFSWLKKKMYPVVITNHAEFFYTGNCAHAKDCDGYMYGCKKCDAVFDTKHKYLINRTHAEWKRMKKAFGDADNFLMTVVSPWQRERIRTSPIARDMKIAVVENGVNTEIFKKKGFDLDEYQVLGNSGKKIILNVTSNFSDSRKDAKGGYYLLEVAKKMPENLFLVAGNVNVTDNNNVPENVILLGNVTKQEKLADYYNLADLTIVTSKRETFGMSVAESMACGTPVVGFYAGGTESVALKEYSEFIEYADVDGLAELIRKWQDKKKYVSEQLACVAIERYSVQRMAEEYMLIYRKIMKKKEA